MALLLLFPSAGKSEFFYSKPVLAGIIMSAMLLAVFVLAYIWFDPFSSSLLECDFLLFLDELEESES